MIDDSLFVARGEDLPPLVHEVIVPTDRFTAFRALATEEGLEAWLERRSLIDLRIGGAYEIYFDSEKPPGLRGSEGCQILAYVPGEMLALSWNAPPSFPNAREKRAWAVFSFVEVEPTRTRVKVTYLGLGTDGEWPQVRAYFDRAWPMFLRELAEHFGKTSA
jgi:uncharacterized protein YndB with AHSA1/START domain